MSRADKERYQYNYALYAWKNDPCAGLYGNFQSKTGQSAEAGRDQGHTKDGIAWAAQAARVIQSQGRDVYGYGDDLLLKASEYAAKYNLGYDVDYDRKFFRCEAILVNGPWSQPSAIGRGVSPGAFDVSFERSFSLSYHLFAAANCKNTDHILSVRRETRQESEVHYRDEKGH